MTCELHKPIHVFGWTVGIEFKLADLWIGTCFNTDDIGLVDIWICLLPCLPIHISCYGRY